MPDYQPKLPGLGRTSSPQPENLEWLRVPGVSWCMVAGTIVESYEDPNHARYCPGPHRMVAVRASKDEYPDFRRADGVR